MCDFLIILAVNILDLSLFNVDNVSLREISKACA